MESVNQPVGPHQAIKVNSAAERFLTLLFDRLWDNYRNRVEHVMRYEEVIQQHKARFVNDHIAFRTFACQSPFVGIPIVARMFESLGYHAVGIYAFEDMFLKATHYQHENSELPKLFISELQVWRLSPQGQQIVARALAQHRPAISMESLTRLTHIEKQDEATWAYLLDRCVDWIERLPWPPPIKSDVLALNEESQYGAWTLVHGYNVNHFTSLINSHGVDALGDIEHTVAALQAAGVPMKPEIEGRPGSPLRQTATTAAMVDVSVRENDHITTMPWTYAYFELAERGYQTDPQTGEKRRFEGFLGPQASQLFEMTRTSRASHE